MKRKDIIYSILCVLVIVAGIGAMLWIIFGADWSSPTDTSQAERATYTQHEPNGHCSILASKCIVDEWSPKCLWFDCIVDGRGKE